MQYLLSTKRFDDNGWVVKRFAVNGGRAYSQQQGLLRTGVQHDPLMRTDVVFIINKVV